MKKFICGYCGEEMKEAESFEKEEDGLICESCSSKRESFLLLRID